MKRLLMKRLLMKIPAPLSSPIALIALPLALLVACGTNGSDEAPSNGTSGGASSINPSGSAGMGMSSSGGAGNGDGDGDDTSGSGSTTGASTGGNGSEELRPQPNVLIIIADDFGLDKASLNPDAPCYDSGDTADDPPLPNLAELCNEGTRFENAWATPTCSPTRASMLSGSLPSSHGVGGPLDNANALALDTVTLPELLNDAGYATANIGKWHLSRGDSDPNTLGWGHYAGSLSGGLPSYNDWTRVVDGQSAQETGYATTVTVDDAVSWLDQQPDEQPWLLWLAFNAPHAPFHKPPNELHDYDYLDETLSGDPEPYYAAMTQAMDTEIGRLLSYLKARNLSDDTLIVFLGDNGTPGQVASTPVTTPRAKASLYEGGLRVPFLVAGPGIAAGKSITSPISVADLFTTLQAVAGLEPIASPDSSNLWPLLTEFATFNREPVISELFGQQVPEDKAGKAIRDDTHKLICFEDGHRELYNLAEDPWESNDLLAAGSAPAGVEAALSTTLETKTGTSICSP